MLTCFAIRPRLLITQSDYTRVDKNFSSKNSEMTHNAAQPRQRNVMKRERESRNTFDEEIANI